MTLGSDWRWVLTLYDQQRERTMFTALECRGEEALKQLASDYDEALARIAQLEAALWKIEGLYTNTSCEELRVIAREALGSSVETDGGKP